MAGEISSLSLLNEPSGALQVEVLDGNDTTMSSNGTNKRAVLAGLYKIADTQVLSSAGEFDFSSIPAGFKRLVLKGTIRLSAASTSTARLFINGDTTEANYHHQHISANNGGAVVTEGAYPLAGIFPVSTGPADSYGTLTISIPNYTGSQLKQARCEFASYVANDQIQAGTICIVSAITAAITQLQVRAGNHPTSGLLGQMTLYAEF